MKIEFTTDAITEYATGNFYVKNTGQPFDIPEGTAEDFLSVKHALSATPDPETGRLEFIPVFKPAEVEGNAIAIDGEPETPDTLAKKTRAELIEIAQELGLDGDTYTNKTELAAAIFAVKGDK